MLYCSSIFQVSTAKSICNIYKFAKICPDSCNRLRNNVFIRKGTESMTEYEAWAEAPVLRYYNAVPSFVRDTMFVSIFLAILFM